MGFLVDRATSRNFVARRCRPTGLTLLMAVTVSVGTEQFGRRSTGQR